MDIISKTRTFVSDPDFLNGSEKRGIPQRTFNVDTVSNSNRQNTCNYTDHKHAHVFPNHLPQMCLDLIYLSVLTGGNRYLVVCEMRSNQCSRHFCKLHLLVHLEWPVEGAWGQSGGCHRPSQKCSVKCEWQQHGERFHGCRSGFSRKRTISPLVFCSVGLL